MGGEQAASQRSVFISYAKTDARVAEGIARTLEESGARIFYDLEIASGDSWARSLAAGIEAADRVIVLMSPEYFESRWCQAELSEAFRMEKQIIPVLVRPCHPTGPLQYLQWLNFENNNPEAILRLVTLVMAP